MNLPQKDLRALHIIRALQPIHEAEIPRSSVRVDIIRFVKMDLVTELTGGYALTEKGQAALRHGD